MAGVFGGFFGGAAPGGGPAPAGVAAGPSMPTADALGNLMMVGGDLEVDPLNTAAAYTLARETLTSAANQAKTSADVLFTIGSSFYI